MPRVTKSPGLFYRYRGSFEHGRVEYISPEVEHILGYSAAEIEALVVENMLLPWLAPHVSHGADYVEYLKQSFVPGMPMTAVNRATTKSGQIRWILLSARPVEDHGDGTFSLDGVILDVTDQVEKQALAGPEPNVLLRIMRTVVHDIANVLAAVRMFADLIVDETETESNANRYAGRIVKACDGGAEKVKAAAAQLRLEEKKAAGETRVE